MKVNLFVSLMRTVVPVVAGVLLTLAARLGFDLEGSDVTLVVTAAFTGAYYLVFRLLELASQRLDWEPLRLVAGVLLGWARPPEYETGVNVAGVRVRLDTDSFGKDLSEALERANRAQGRT